MKETKETKVKFLEKAGFAGLSCGTNIAFNLKSIYYSTFLKMILNIPVSWVGIIVMVGTIWDAINDPLIGYWSVNHKFKTGEKIRPLVKYFTIPWAITYVLIFTNFNLPQTPTIIACIAIYILFEAFYTFLCIPYNSLAALATTDDGERKSINSFRSVGGLIGTVFATILTTPLLIAMGGFKDSKIFTPADSIPLFKTACVLAVIAAIGCFFHYFTSHERIRQQEDSEEKISFMDTFKMLFSIKSWVANMLFILCYGIASALIMAEINDYAAYIKGDSSIVTPVLGVYVVVAILGSFVIDKIDDKYGRKATMIFSALVQVVGKIPFIIAPEAMINIYINAATAALGIQGAFVLFNTNRNNVCDMVEFKFHKRIDSMVATCDNLITKLAEAAAMWAMNAALDVAGYDALLGVNQTAATKTTICALLGWVPALICLFMAYFAYKCNIQKEYKDEQAKYLAK